MAIKQDYINWYNYGKRIGATHVILVCEEVTENVYPTYVMPPTEAQSLYNDIDKLDMVHVITMMDLSQDRDSQLALIA